MSLIIQSVTNLSITFSGGADAAIGLIVFNTDSDALYVRVANSGNPQWAEITATLPA